MCCSSQHRSYQAADLEAADLCQHVQRVCGVRSIDKQGTLHGVYLSGQACIIYTCAPSHCLFRRSPSYNRSDGGRGRGIADAHLAHAEYVQPSLNFSLNYFNASHYRLESLIPAHRWSVCEIASSWCDLLVHQVGMGLQVTDHTHIYHNDPRPYVPGQDIDRRSAVEEILYHLRRDRLWISADSLGDYAVITSHCDDNLVLDFGQGLVKDAGQLNREIFQTAQAAARLGKGILVITGYRY